MLTARVLSSLATHRVFLVRGWCVCSSNLFCRQSSISNCSGLAEPDSQLPRIPFLRRNPRKRTDVEWSANVDKIFVGPHVQLLAVIGLVFMVNGLATAATNLPDCPTSGRPGFTISKVSTHLCFQDLDSKHRNLYVPSPDGSVVLTVDGYEGKKVQKWEDLGPAV